MRVLVITELDSEKPRLNISTLDKLLLTVKIARPRTWMFAVVSYLYAYLESNSPIMWQVAVGIVIFSVLTGATNMINAYTDMPEDQINNPIRLKWINQLGVRNLIRSTFIVYSSVILLSLPFGPVFTLVVIVAVFDSIFYSLPPIRFKRHPVTALISFSGAVGLPFFAGLVASNRLNLIDPWFILFTLFMLTYGTIKNVPDFLGDQLAGLKTTVTAFEDFKEAVKVSSMLLILPYLLLVFFVGMGILSKMYLLNILLMAFPVYWAYRNLRTNNREGLEKLHTQGFIYAISFYLFNFILSQSSPVSLVITFSVMLTIFMLTNLRIDSRI